MLYIEEVTLFKNQQIIVIKIFPAASRNMFVGFPHSKVV